MNLETYLVEVLPYLSQLPPEKYLKYHYGLLLCYFAGCYRSRNAYQISASLAGKNDVPIPMQYFSNSNDDELRPIAPKNMREKMRKLEQIGLIRKIPLKLKPDGRSRQTWIHNAQNYELTTGGLFYLITKHPPNLMLDFSLTLEHHRNNIIFKTFLYPYLSYETFQKLGMVERTEIFKYLKRCCDYTWTFIKFQIDKSSPAKFAGAFRWNKLNKPEGHDGGWFLTYLYRRFKLNPLLDVIKGKKKLQEFEKSSDGNKVTVRIDNNLAITALLDSSKKIVTVSVSDGRSDTFTVRQVEGHLFCDVTMGTLRERFLEQFQQEVNDAFSDLIAALIWKPTGAAIQNRKESMSVLWNDKLFRQAVLNYHQRGTQNLELLESLAASKIRSASATSFVIIPCRCSICHNRSPFILSSCESACS